jgi:hypothetical protein
MGGTGYAAIALPRNSVGTKQLKDGAVTQAKIKAHSLGRRVINFNALGQVPSAASANTANTANTATSANSASVANTANSAPIAKVTYVSSTVTIPNSPTTTPAAANCPAGTTVTGGGASVTDEANELVNDSYPNGKTGWTADIYNNGGPATATVTAICAPAAATAP